MQQANHRNVAQIRYIGRDEAQDIARIVMPLYTRGCLEQAMRNNGGSLPIGRALRYTDHVLLALAHTHTRGMIHADIKPSNILIGDDDEGLLTDFGQSVDMLMSGPGVGMAPTPQMYGWIRPPEVFSHLPVDLTADLYQVGILLYRLINGKRLWKQQMIRAASDANPGMFADPTTDPTAWSLSLTLAIDRVSSMLLTLSNLSMTLLPKWFTGVLEGFAPLFSARIWPQMQLLAVGALLSPGKRTVTAALRVLGLADDPRFGTFHRLLNRARWSSLQASRVLLCLLLAAFVPSGPLVLGLDDTIERRTGAKISAKGIYRDPVRSSHGHFVKASGLRWLSLMLLTPIPWARRIWALPFLTALVPSQRYNEERGHRHKTLTDWARQMLRVVQRWCPGRQLIVVADSAYAVIRWLSDLQQGQPITVITRLRLDAALYDPAPERLVGQMGRTRLKGNRLPTLASLVQDPETRWERVRLHRWYGETNREVEVVSQTAIWYHNGLPPLQVRWVLVRDPQGKFSTQALLCTDLLQTSVQILEYFVQRWQLEVTFEEVRAHLGVETQRQWTDLAIARTTPALLGLFSLVTLMAHERWQGHEPWVRRAAWYDKTLPTFVDALAEIRRALWKVPTFRMSAPGREMIQVPLDFIERLADALCYAA